MISMKEKSNKERIISGMETELTEIKVLLEKADVILSAFNTEEQQLLLEEHGEEFSLPFCLRWGLQAVEDLTDPNRLPF